jgi:hypothetical protein
MPPRNEPEKGTLQTGIFIISNVSSKNYATLKDSNKGTPVNTSTDAQAQNVKVRRNSFGMNLRANNPLSSSGTSPSSTTTGIILGHTSTAVLMPESVPTQARKRRLWEGPMSTNGTSRKLVNRVNTRELSHRCLISLLVADGTSY